MTKPPRRGARTRRLALIAGIGAAMGIMFALVYLHVVLAQRQMTLDKMTSVEAARAADYQALRLRVAQLESPQQIISVAEGRLGMHQPPSVQYLSPASSAAASTLPGSGTSAPKANGSKANETQAPQGDSAWPTVKSALAGNP